MPINSVVNIRKIRNRSSCSAPDWGVTLSLSPSSRPDHARSRGRGHQHPGPWGGRPALLHREQVGGHHAAPMWEPLCRGWPPGLAARAAVTR